MPERCELCGARLYPDEPACRDCGTAVESAMPDAPLPPPPDFDSAASSSGPMPAAAAAAAASTSAVLPGSGSVAGTDGAAASTAGAAASTAGAAASTAGAAALGVPSESADAMATLADAMTMPAEGSLAGVPIGADASTSAPVPPPNATPAPEPATSPEARPSQAFAAQTSPGDFVLDPADDASPKSRGALVAAAVVAVLVAVGATVWFLWLRPTPAEADDNSDGEVQVAGADAGQDPSEAGDGAGGDPACAAAQALAGHWTMTTEVVASIKPGQLGARGFYELDVEVSQCEPTVRLSRTGYTGRRFGDKRIERAQSSLRPGPDGVLTGTFALRDESGRGDDLVLALVVEGETLFGTWRMLLATGPAVARSGIVMGARGEVEQPRPTLSTQPCAMRCAVACGGLQRPVDAPPPALGPCLDACPPGAEGFARCGEIPPRPEALALPMSGPTATLDEACGGKCDKKPRGNAAKMYPSLGGKQIEAPWDSVRIVGAGGLRLALHHERGWFISPPLPKLNEPPQLVGRSLSEGQGKTHVIVLYGRSRRILCRVAGEGPSCVLVPLDGLAVDPIPGGVLSIARTAAASAADAEQPAVPEGLFTY